MKHSDVEELLASYALDAVDPAEVVLVDAHLAECARCRAEVARHRELASMLTGSPEEPPAELWERISGALAEPDPDYAGGAADATPVAPITNLSEAQRGRSKLGKGVLAALAAAAAAVIVVMALQVSHLNGQVAKMQASVRSSGLASAVSSALVGPHREIQLTSSGGRSAEVVITPSGQAYWVRSSLPHLSPDRTYQLWALVKGKPVSVGLVGSNPSRYAAFRVERGTSALMVTAEPAGGTPQPTTKVVVERAISA